MASGRLTALTEAGVSIWLDDLVKTRHVSGVTTNPSIFAKVIGRGEFYADQVDDLAARVVVAGRPCGR